ncbi:hypothetical protein EYF80_004962 [Liparis tanakae]|uniref:Uncharacterized protein n=1 Tax=Liparis tanakae TaxID=230148 RepID=A0A4Z2J4H2_9TELE|nr:hypothetical protein EYF80_004962 [Liparis tanakae]
MPHGRGQGARERWREDEERNGGEGNYKLVDSPGASRRHFTAVYGVGSGSRAAPCGAGPTTGTGRGVITPLNTARGGISGRGEEW